MSLPSLFPDQELAHSEELTINDPLENDEVFSEPIQENGDGINVTEEASILQNQQIQRSGSDEPLLLERILGRQWMENDSWRIFERINSEFERLGGERNRRGEVAAIIVNQEVQNIMEEAEWSSSGEQLVLVFHEIVHVVYGHIMQLSTEIDNLAQLIRSDNRPTRNALSKETIQRCLKTRHHNWTIGDGELPEICVVCQDCLYQQHESIIATLECGHEYHVNCIKQWLQVKNICPVCRDEALHIQ